MAHVSCLTGNKFLGSFAIKIKVLYIIGTVQTYLNF